MQEPDNRKEEKLEAREIRIGGPTTREERPHGRFYRWFDNYWYHHKWKTIIIAFFVIVFVVCTAQMCSKPNEPDVRILVAGPTNFSSEKEGTKDLEAFFSAYVREDYNGDESKQAQVNAYTVLSTEQIKQIEQTKDEETDQNVMLDHSVYSGNYSSFYSYLSTGETAILILDRWLYEEIKAKGMLVDLTTQLGTVPEGGILEEDGNSCFGVALKDTALYKEQLALQVLEEDYVAADPVICLCTKFLIMDQQSYDSAVQYLKGLIG